MLSCQLKSAREIKIVLLAKLIVLIHLYARGRPTSGLISIDLGGNSHMTHNRRDSTFPHQLDAPSRGPEP